MNWQDYIVSNNEVLLGKPTIKGTRLSVDHIVSLFAQGRAFSITFFLLYLAGADYKFIIKSTIARLANFIS